MASQYVLAVLFLCVTYSSCRKLPSYIQYCKYNDPHINECFKKAIETIRPHLKEGVPEFGLPSMNPLLVPEANLDTGNSFKAKFSNIEVYYADEFVVDDAKIDLEKDIFRFELTFPRLRIKSLYDIDGKILIFQFKGKGPADGNYTNVHSSSSTYYSRYLKNGKHYYRVQKNDIHVDVGKPTFHFSNLFKDNKELSEQTNKAINDNVVELTQELKPVIEEVISKFNTGIIQRVFDRFSIEELFPK